jgi:hypothetical protein
MPGAAERRTTEGSTVSTGCFPPLSHSLRIFLGSRFMQRPNLLLLAGGRCGLGTSKGTPLRLLLKGLRLLLKGLS